MATADRIISSPPIRLPRTEARIPRRLKTQLVLLLAAAAIVATGLVVVGGRDGSSTWQHTFDATNGPHVVVSGLPGTDLRPLTRLPGLSESSGPFPGLQASLRHDGREAGVWLEGRSRATSIVDHPLIVSGTWVRPGGVVLDQSLANQLGARAGDRLAVGDTSVRVAGIAQTSASGRYGSPREGLAYALPATLRKVVPDATTFGSTLMLRLSDADRSGDYAAWIEARYPSAQVTVGDWKSLRSE